MGKSRRNETIRGENLEATKPEEGENLEATKPEEGANLEGTEQ